MAPWQQPVQLRWSDFDPNGHMRHSAYYDLAAMHRVRLFADYGLTSAVMHRLHIGPILFREECQFRREIHFEDDLTVGLVFTGLREDYSRFAIRHELLKADGTLCALITVEGAWIDTQLRKLTIPPPEVTGLCEKAPRSSDFVWLTKKT